MAPPFSLDVKWVRPVRGLADRAHRESFELGVLEQLQLPTCLRVVLDQNRRVPALRRSLVIRQDLVAASCEQRAKAADPLDMFENTGTGLKIDGEDV